MSQSGAWLSADSVRRASASIVASIKGQRAEKHAKAASLRGRRDGPYAESGTWIKNEMFAYRQEETANNLLRLAGAVISSGNDLIFVTAGDFACIDVAWCP